MLACKNSNKILAAYICVSSGRQTLVLVVETFLTFIIEDLCMIDITWQMCPSSCSINILSWFLTCFGPRSIFSKNIRWTTLLCWHLMNNRPKLYCTRLHFSGTIYQGFMELCGPRWESLLYYAEKWSMYRSTFARVSQSSVRRPLLFYGRFLFFDLRECWCFLHLARHQQFSAIISMFHQPWYRFAVVLISWRKPCYSLVATDLRFGFGDR